MRYEKIQIPTLSLATTKGWSGKNSHHALRSATPINFVGVDGEGMTVDGRHRYVLFGVGDEQIENPDGLQWREVFDFLYRFNKPETAFVGFYLGYDFTQIFATLPQDRAYMLLSAEGRRMRKHRIPGKAPHPVESDGWQFDILGSKRLRIRPKGCECPVATCKCTHEPWMYVCDVGSFFQASFLTVIDPDKWASGTEVVTPEEYATIRAGKERRSTAVLDDDMRFYNRLENEILARVMRTVDRGFHDIGIHLPASKWFGPGQAAQAWLKSEKVPTAEDLREVVPDWFNEAARMSYFGGWFEIMMHGIIPGETHEYDINSAYPSIIAKLPCLRHGNYSHGIGIPTGLRSDSICFVYGQIWSPGMPDDTKRQHIGAMLHRDSHGRICRPTATEGWFNWRELVAAQRAGLVKKLDNRGKQKITKWVRYDPCDCPPPMAGIGDLYGKRLAVGKATPLGKGAKLVYNSAYGKFAQSVGDPLFGNPVYAALITSGCRAQILDAISSHPDGKKSVAMVATDGVYFLTPHPGLKLSDKLGEWEHNVKRDLTLFKPGVYWDNKTRKEIAEGRSPHFKARGFRAADFMTSLAKVDAIFRAWHVDDRYIGEWPRVSFRPSFTMVTALQALQRNAWESAGAVAANPEPITQSSDPVMKRDGVYRDTYDGRTVFRSRPYWGLYQGLEDFGAWIPSHPYEKRFGMENPWSDDSKAQFGQTEDGNVMDILAWILTGE